MSARTIIQTAKPINFDIMKNQLNNQIIAPITAINSKITNQSTSQIRKSVLCPWIKEQIRKKSIKILGSHESDIVVCYVFIV